MFQSFQDRKHAPPLTPWNGARPALLGRCGPECLVPPGTTRLPRRVSHGNSLLKFGKIPHEIVGSEISKLFQSSISLITHILFAHISLYQNGMSRVPFDG